MVPIHPEACPDPQVVRWRTPPGALPRVGRVTAAPEPVQRLFDDGTVASVHVGPDHLDVALADGRAWATDGGRVRTALLAGLDQPDGWSTVAAEPPGEQHRDEHDDDRRDDRLRAAAEVALAGEVGELARSHGGAIELDSVADGVVTVRMRGACHGCPAAEVTLHARLERALREACPDLREVRSLEQGTGLRRAAQWLILGHREA